MAIIHFINRPKSQTKAGMLFTMRYTMRDDKTVFDGKKLVTGINCTPSSAYTQFRNTKLLFGKDGGRQYYHFVQSFPISENVSPELAHEIALRFISETEKFEGFEVVASTHSDRLHTHTHFILNSVNAETGKKFHISQDDIEMLMTASDKIIADYGLSVCVPDPEKQKKKHMSDREYRTSDKGQSWKLQLAIQIDEAMKYARSREDLIEIMSAEGYGVRWTDTRKDITYTCPNGKKCCDDKLHEEKYLKGSMENEFRIRQEILGGTQKTSDRATENGIESRTGGDGFGAELEGDDRFTGNGNRPAFADSREAGYADDGRENGGLYESAAAYSHEVNGENDRGGSELREGKPSDRGANATENGFGSRGIYRKNEEGSREFILTGWESERTVFAEFISGEGRDEAFYKAAVSDFSDSLGHLGDGLTLIAGAGNIIDSDHPVQDCTTMKHQNNRKKKQEQYSGGPVMGGM